MVEVPETQVEDKHQGQDASPPAAAPPEEAAQEAGSTQAMGAAGDAGRDDTASVAERGAEDARAEQDTGTQAKAAAPQKGCAAESPEQSRQSTAGSRESSSSASAAGQQDQRKGQEADAGETGEGASGEDDGPKRTPAGAETFAELLDQSDTFGRDVSVGEKISGVVIKVEGDYAFVDFGGRSEGVIRADELRNSQGELEYSVGDPLEAFVATAQDEIRLTRRLSSRDGQTDMLYQAYKSGMPVEGRVDAVNKWGLGITIHGGVRGFCPISQVDTAYVDNPEEYRDKTMSFRIIEFRNQGRNIVLSRRSLLEAEKVKEEDEIRAAIKKGAELAGTVTRLEDFGAFVSLGAGVEGLVHISEISHKRIGHPQEVLNVGDPVKVAVLRTKDLGSRRKERISLSIRALERDPWDSVKQDFSTGTVVDGKVSSLEDFGAFVELAPGIRGLLHVSEIANRRVGHPREELELGQNVKVVVLEVDARRRRLRLSMKQVESMESAANLRDFQQRRKQEEQGEAGSGAMVDALRRANLID